MSVFSVETLLYAVIQRYGWDNNGHSGRQLTITREELDTAEASLRGRNAKLELQELPSHLLVIHTRPTDR
jgi:hypothetical protein